MVMSKRMGQAGTGGGMERHASGRVDDSSRRRTRRLGLGFAALAVVLLGAASTAGAAQVRSEFYGITQGQPFDLRDAQGVQAAHVHTMRYLFSWESVQPKTKNKFNWGTQDQFIGRLAAKGVRVVPSIWGNPSWVAGYTAHPPLDRPQDVQAWQTFLKAIVARYGPGGAYWKGPFRSKHPTATPLPMQAYQIWNEPNLKKYFTPYPAPKTYGRLLKAAHSAIKSKQPGAQVVFGGMPGYGDVNAWDYLNQFYNQVPQAKTLFEVAALHPYGGSIDKVKSEITKFRKAMTSHGDRATPLWITEIGWGSAPPDKYGINKGPKGQSTMLKSAYNMFLANQSGWNLQRVFWYHWRDPRRSHASCSFCASAGLIRTDRTPKPAAATFKSFTTDSTPPTTSFTSGPADGATISNATPTFKFRSSEPASTFECRVDGGAFKACKSPFKTAPLSNGNHSVSVRATDVVGNIGVATTRSFTVNAS